MNYKSISIPYQGKWINYRQNNAEVWNGPSRIFEGREIRLFNTNYGFDKYQGHKVIVCSINTIKSAYKILGEGDSLLNSSMYKKEDIFPDVVKYEIKESGIKHLLVYLENDSILEVSVYCGDDSISLKEARECFSKELVGYNFRENYTQFLFETNNPVFPHVAFILDNEIIFDENERAYIEKTPRGKKTVLREVLFNGFVLRKN